MNAEEYREKEGFTDANFWTGSEIDFDSIYEFAEDYHNAKLKLLDIPIVSKSVAKQYAEFCVRCDREKLPLIKIEDYLKQLK